MGLCIMNIQQPDGMPSGKPNCGVVALATTLNLPYDKAYNYLRRHKGAGWKGSTKVSDLLDGVKALGGKYTEISSGGTLKKWIEWNTIPDATYLIRVSKHILAVRNGIVVDQSEVLPVDEHHFRRCRVTHAYKITMGKYTGAGDKVVVPKRNTPKYDKPFWADGYDLDGGWFVREKKIQHNDYPTIEMVESCQWSGHPCMTDDHNQQFLKHLIEQYKPTTQSTTYAEYNKDGVEVNRWTSISLSNNPWEYIK